MDAFLAMIGDLAAGVAAVAALTGARYARQTVREARAERLEAEHVRLVRRLEWVGETIEHSRPVGETWRRGRHLLAQGFVGLDNQLPRTAELTRCADPYSARSVARLAREEVGGELQRLAREQARRHEEQADADQPGPGRTARPTVPRFPGRRRDSAPDIPGHHQHRLRRSHGG
jgi:hypothetical protein